MTEVQSKLDRAVWRRALALTGSNVGAGDVLAAVWKVQPDLLRLGESRLTRLTVLESRQWVSRRGGYAGEDGPKSHGASDAACQFAYSLADLSSELREAYLLTEFLGMEELEASQALGVAKAIVSRNHRIALETLNARLGSDFPGAEREWAAIVRTDPTADALAAVRARQSSIKSRKRLTALIQFVIFVTIIGVVLWIGFGMLNRQSNQPATPETTPSPNQPTDNSQSH